jgi:hypothetical protein
VPAEDPAWSSPEVLVLLWTYLLKGLLLQPRHNVQDNLWNRRTLRTEKKEIKGSPQRRQEHEITLYTWFLDEHL